MFERSKFIKLLNSPLSLGLLLVLGLLIRIFIMPWSMHSDVLSMSWRSFLIGYYGMWNFPTNQYLSHLVYAINILFLQKIGLEPETWFQQPFGLYPGSKTASVGDWLVFLEHPKVNAILFGLQMPHLLVDIGIVISLWWFLRSTQYWRLAIVSWWLNPVVIFASYIFDRHDVFTSAAVLALIVVLAKKKIWASVVAVFIGFQIRVQPLLYAPLVMITLWRQHSDKKKLFKNSVFAAFTIVAYFFFRELLPFDSVLYKQIVRVAPSSSTVFDATTYFSNKVIPLIAPGGYGVIFFAVVVLIFLKMWWLYTPRKETTLVQIEKIAAGIVILLSLFFACVSASPHYFIWLCLPVSILVAFQPKILKIYGITVLAWFIKSLLLSDLTVFSQHLFLPVSLVLWQLPTLAQVISAQFGSEFLLVLQRLTQSISSFSLIWLAYKTVSSSFSEALTEQSQRLRVWNTKHRMLFIVSVVLILLGSFQIQKFFKTQLTQRNPNVWQDTLQEKDEVSWYWIKPGEEVSGIITTDQPTLSRVEIRLSNYNNPKNEYFTFKIKRLNSPNWQYEATYSLQNIYSGWYFPIGFPPIEGANTDDLLWQIILPAENTSMLGVKDVVAFKDINKKQLIPLIIDDAKKHISQQPEFFTFYTITVGVLSILLIKMCISFVKNSRK